MSFIVQRLVNYRDIWMGAVISAVITQVITWLDETIRKIMTGFTPEIVSGVQIFAIIAFVTAAIFFVFDKKTRTGNTLSYTPNHLEYWNHIEKLQQSLENDIKKSVIVNNKDKKKTMEDLFNKLNHVQPNTTKNIPNFYKIIKQSSKKMEYVQHLVTYYTSDLSLLFAFVNNLEKDKNLDYRHKEDAINYFNTKFQHIYEIMNDSKPLIGLCDGCKMDYYGEDRETCIEILENIHKDKDGFIRKLFID